MPIQVAAMHTVVLRKIFVNALNQFPLSNKPIVSIEKDENVV